MSDKFVALAPLSGKPTRDWQQERWNEVMEWLDAQGITFALVAKEVYMQEPGKRLELVTDKAEPEQIDELFERALCVVTTKSDWLKKANAVGAKTVVIKPPTKDVTVGSVIDQISEHCDIDVIVEPTISACIICRNEMHSLPGCVESVRPCADEIVVVDTGSTDGTREWLREQKDIITLDYDLPGGLIQSFSDVRNYGIENASGKYILWLDSPDRLKDAKMLRSYIRSQSADAYFLRVDLPNGGFIRREKVVLRAFAWFQDRVHEFIQLGGLKDITLRAEMGIRREVSKKVNREASVERNARLLNMMLEEEPNHPRRGRWYFALGMDLHQGGRHDEAMEHLYKRLEVGGWDDETFATLIALGQILLYHKQDADQALEVADHIESVRPQCREAPYMRAEAYRLKCDFYNARAWYEQTLKGGNVQSAWSWPEAYGDDPQKKIAEMSNPQLRVVGID